MDVIKEFLVALGFKVDEAGFKKFNGAILGATKDAAELGVSMTGAATAVALAVSKIAQQYNDLYYMSVRTKSSVANLKAQEFGFRNIGLSAEQSRAQVESFAAAVRMNPGLAAFLKNMGVDPKDTVNASNAFVGRLRAQFGEAGYFTAARIAQMFGLDEGVFKQMWDHFDTLQAKTADYNRRLRESGVQTQKLAKDSNDFNRSLEGLSATIGLLGDQTAQKWLPSMKSGVDLLDQLAMGLVRVGRDTDGWSSTILSLVAALGGLKASAWLLRLLGAGRLAGIAAGASGGAATSLLLGPAGLLAGVGGAAVYATSQTPEGQAWKATGQVTKDLPSMLSAIKPTLQRWLGVDTGAGSNNKDRVIAALQAQGWTREQATGIAASLHGESKFNPRAYNPAGGGRGAHGIGQWRGKRLDDFRRVIGKDISESSLEEQLAFHQWELENTEAGAGGALKRAQTAGEAAAIHSRMFERHGIGSEDDRRARLASQWFNASAAPAGAGGGGVQITQKTDIHVDGSGDPAKVAAQVADSQSRVNGDLVRNLRGATR